MRTAALLLAVAIGLTGCYGAWRYGHDYDLYRGFPPPKEAAGVARGRLEQVQFHSAALGAQRSYLAYLPPGYDQGVRAGRRYPVLYLLQAPHGQARNYLLAGALGVRIDEMIARGSIRPFVTIMPEAHGFGSDHEWANAADGHYESFVLDTVRNVDAHFSTVHSRRARMVAGLSAGGYGAVNVALHHLRTFGSFESWSGYFTVKRELTFRNASPALLHANSPALYLGALTHELRRLPVRAFLYQGTKDHDETPAQLAQFAHRLAASGSHVGYAVYPGGHSWALWRAQLPHMLQFASRAIGAPR